MIHKPKKGEYIEVLLRSSQTVFSTKDIALLWRTEVDSKVRVRLSQYVRTGKLIRLRRGIYAKDTHYSRLELATRIYTPAYISFETVLTHTGINFQYYKTIFVASYITCDIQVGGQTISFVRVKDEILRDTSGIEQIDLVATATKERAFLDRIYVSKDYHFDNLGVLDWNKVFEILPIYRNKRMTKKVKEYFDQYQKEHKK